MTNETQSANCKVICDLMVVYASGEASAETVAFIEAHLDECPECREAYEAAQRGEDLLAALDPVEKPFTIDGRKILLRLQRVFFGLSALVLLLAVLGIAFFERVIVQGVFGLQLPSLYILGGLDGGVEWILAAVGLVAVFGGFHYWRTTRATDADSPFLALIGAALLFVTGLAAYKFMVQADVPGTIIAGTLTFALYIYMLRWRAGQGRGRLFGGGMLSLETAIPLFILILAMLTQLSAASFPAGLIALGLVVVALFFTLIQLDHLPYMTLLTLAALFAGGVMLLANAVGGFASLFDLTVDRPADLGHPDEPGSPVNLTPLGYTHLDSSTVTEISRVLLVGGEARQAAYTRSGGGPAFVTVIEFPDRAAAAEFFRTWEASVDGGFYAIHLDLNNGGYNDPDGYADHPLHWDLELPGVWFGQEGQIARGYDEDLLTGYNAWQIDEWVTIIQVEGGVAQAIPLSRQIKETVAESYR